MNPPQNAKLTRDNAVWTPVLSEKHRESLLSFSTAAAGQCHRRRPRAPGEKCAYCGAAQGAARRRKATAFQRGGAQSSQACSEATDGARDDAREEATDVPARVTRFRSFVITFASMCFRSGY